MLKVQGGVNESKRKFMAPTTVEIGGHEIPIDIPLLLVGFILAVWNQQIVSYVQVDSNILRSFGELLLLAGAVLFIFGRIELKK